MPSKNSSATSTTTDPTQDTAPDTSAQPEIPEQPAQTPADTTGTNGASDGSEAAGGASADPQETGSGQTSAAGTGSETPEDESGETSSSAEPEVVNDANGQHVIMADGKVITTRQHTFPVSNAEQSVFELTHTGDQLRYPYVPGDAEYSPYSDPAVPNTHLAQMIEREIISFGERVLTDSKAAISPMWNGLKGIFENELENAINTGVTSGKVRL